MDNRAKISLIIEDLEQWADAGGNESDDSMLYALNQGYTLHAASLWLSTGATSENVLEQVKGVKINSKKEYAEVKQLCESADIFICPDCNHHGFYEAGELDVPPQCFSCGGDKMKLETKGGN